MQEERTRGVSKVGQIEMEFMQKRMEDAERFEQEKNGNYALKVKIKCFKHGIFYQTPNAHLRGDGCPNCGYSRCLSGGAGKT